MSSCQYFYDLQGNKSKVVEKVVAHNSPDREIITRWTYDCMKRVTLCTDACGTPEQMSTHYRYLPNGTLAGIAKGNSVELLHEYDALGRLVSFRGSDHSFHYIYTYDLNNNPIQVKDLINQTEINRSFDDNNRLREELLPNKLLSKYTYDRIGRVVKLQLPDSSFIEYDYQGLLLQHIHRKDKSGAIKYTHTYDQYDQSHNLLAMTLPGNAGKVAFDYDCLNQPTSIHAPQWNEIAHDYDAVGNVLQKTSTDSLGAYTSQFAYDGMYQLISERGVFSHDYTNDSVYNHIQKDGHSQQFNALNQLLADATSTYEYDANGNLKSLIRNSEKQTFDYDALGRLTRVTTQDKQYCYQYDAFNRRMSKTCLAWNGEAWAKVNQELYLYNGGNEIGSTNEKTELQELRVLGMIKQIEQGSNAAIELQEEVLVPINDLRGNTACLVDLEGKVVEFYRYSSYGDEEIYDASGQVVKHSRNPWRFAGKRKDAETGFIFFGERYYSTHTYSWITPDPIHHEGGPNLYAYVMHNPLSVWDSYGETGEYIFPYLPPSLYELAWPCRAFCLTGDSGYSMPYLPDFEHFADEKSHCFDLGRYELPDFRITFANGMSNTTSICHENSTHISDMCGGYNVHAIYNSSYGGLGDFIECGLGAMGIATPPVFELYRSWTEYCVSHDKNEKILHFTSSQGAINTYNALLLMNPDYAKRIYVVSIEGAILIPRNLAGDVRNYVNGNLIRDVVPYVHRIIDVVTKPSFVSIKNYIVQNYTNEYHISYVKSSANAPIFDHAITSPTYKEIIGKEYDAFLKWKNL